MRRKQLGTGGNCQMDRVEQYRSLVKQIVLQHAEYAPSHGNVGMRPVFDEDRDSYLRVDAGWDRTGRVYATLLDMQLKDGKVRSCR